MTRSHSSADRGFPVATQTEDDTNFTLWDDGAAWGHELAQNFVFAPSPVNLGYADIVLLADTPNQRPIDHAPFASSVRSISTADGFSNVNGDLVTHIVYSPPDNGIAIGGPNGYIISVVNDTIGWTPDLSETPMQFEAFSQFFPASLVGNMEFTDPQVLYDADHGKFIVTEELFKGNSQSKLLIAVSHDANPNEGWDFFSINSQYSFDGKRTAADYPQSDTDGVNLFITSDQFSGSNYFGSVVTVIPLSSIENGAAGSISYSQFVPNTPNNFKETLDVAGYHEKGAFFVGYDGLSRAGHEYVTIDYYNDSTAQTTFSIVDVEDIDNLGVDPLVATQPNGHLLDANDRRITDVKVIGNDLFAVTEVVPPNSPSSVPNVHWFDFDVTNPSTPILKAQGDLPGTLVGAGAGVTTFNGSVTGDSKYLVLNFTATGPSLNPSDYFAVSTDAGHSWETHQYATSPTSYSDGSKISRWGDYSSAVVDPTHNHAFLISNEYAVDASHWGTKIADFLLA